MSAPPWFNPAAWEFPSGMELAPEYFKPVEFDIGKEHLTGITIGRDLGKSADFAFFHGARVGNKRRVLSFIKPAIDAGATVLAIDHSGHGNSTGAEKQSSLAKREAESIAAIRNFCKPGPITVCGSSMGGYEAIRMIKYFNVKTLLLFCPAVYDRDAFTVPFDQGFSEIIRKSQSWENSDAKEILEAFTGNLLVFIGSEDTVIPPGVIELIDKHSAMAQRKEIVTIPDCPHIIQEWLISHPEKALEVGKKVAEFI